MVANAGVCPTASVLDCPFSSLDPPDLTLIYIFHRHGRSMGPYVCYQHPWCVPLLPICREADDQTRSWGEDHRVLIICWKTRCSFASLLSSETLVDGAPGLPMMSLYGATKSAIRGLTQGAGKFHWILINHGSSRSPRSGKAWNHC